jgi:hypothetical protein
LVGSIRLLRQLAFQFFNELRRFAARDDRQSTKEPQAARATVGIENIPVELAISLKRNDEPLVLSILRRHLENNVIRVHAAVLRS